VCVWVSGSCMYSELYLVRSLLKSPKIVALYRRIDFDRSDRSVHDSGDALLVWTASNELDPVKV
jgi:hypothetical protein